MTGASHITDAAGVRIEIARSLQAVGALTTEWSTLLTRADAATPFQRPEWLLSWWEVFAPDRVAAVAVRNGEGRLIALIPGVARGRVLNLAGGGLSDYLMPVIDRRTLHESIDAVCSTIERRHLDCVFDDVPASAWVDAVAVRRGWSAQPESVCPVVPLPASVDAWRRGLPAGLDRNIRRYGRRLADDAGVRYTTVTTADDLGPALSALFRLHSRRWHERGGMGVLQSAEVRRFHQRSASRLLDAGVLRLHLLAAGSDVIAAQYVLVERDRAYSYIGGFDPAWARYGPGTLLMAYSIAQAIDEGCREFDLLRGDEAYKYAWGAVNRCTLRVRYTASAARPVERNV